MTTYNNSNPVQLSNIKVGDVLQNTESWSSTVTRIHITKTGRIQLFKVINGKEYAILNGAALPTHWLFADGYPTGF